MRVPKKLKKRLSKGVTYWQHKEHSNVVCELMFNHKFMVRTFKWVWRDDKKRKKKNGGFYRYCEEEYKIKLVELPKFLNSFKRITIKVYNSEWGRQLEQA